MHMDINILQTETQANEEHVQFTSCAVHSTTQHNELQ